MKQELSKTFKTALGILAGAAITIAVTVAGATEKFVGDKANEILGQKPVPVKSTPQNPTGEEVGSDPVKKEPEPLLKKVELKRLLSPNFMDLMVDDETLKNLSVVGKKFVVTQKVGRLLRAEHTFGSLVYRKMKAHNTVNDHDQKSSQLPLRKELDLYFYLSIESALTDVIVEMMGDEILVEASSARSPLEAIDAVTSVLETEVAIRWADYLTKCPCPEKESLTSDGVTMKKKAELFLDTYNADLLVEVFEDCAKYQAAHANENMPPPDKTADFSDELISTQ